MAAKKPEESIIETVLKNRRLCNCPIPEGLKGRELTVYELNHKRIHDADKPFVTARRVVVERVR